MPASEIRHHVRWDFAVDYEIVRLRVFTFVCFAEFSEPIRPGGWNVAIDGCRARKGGSRACVSWGSRYLDDHVFNSVPKVSLEFGVASCQDSKMCGRRQDRRESAVLQRAMELDSLQRGG